MILILALTLFAAFGEAPLQAQSVELDFGFYRTEVEPIFLEKRDGFTRCVVCHAGDERVAFLEGLPDGAETWTEEQSRRNFESVLSLVTPGDPLASRLLMHPLDPAAGGDEFHTGGRQFTTQDDPQFRTLAAWVNGEKAGR